LSWHQVVAISPSLKGWWWPSSLPLEGCADIPLPIRGWYSNTV